MTERLNSSPSSISKAANFLKSGELVAFPTETVYGLGAPLFAPDVIRRIFEVKGRPSDNPLIVHIAHLEAAERIARDIPDIFYTLADAFWPGAITFVLPTQEIVPEIVSGGGTTVAIRMPSHPVAQALIAACGQPLVAPSANLSGKPSSTTADHVLADFDGKIAAVIDGGPCHGGLESTVISLLSSEVKLLRPGLITKQEIEKVLGYEIQEGTHENGPLLSPGMKYRHYAPSATVLLFSSLEKLLDHQLKTSKSSKIIYPSSHSYYAELRLADDEGVEEILILCDEAVLANGALFNRIERSAEKKR